MSCGDSHLRFPIGTFIIKNLYFIEHIQEIFNLKYFLGVLYKIQVLDQITNFAAILFVQSSSEL